MCFQVSTVYTVLEDGEKERAFGVGGGEKEGFLPPGQKIIYTVNSY
jgi:hypothetical protein